jgi:ribosomal protein L17
MAVFPRDVPLMARMGRSGIDLSEVLPFSRYEPPLIEGEFRPMPHQLETAAFLAANARAYCTSEMRTGKTGAVIMALDFLNKFGVPGAALIVCPNSIMDGVWRRAVELTLPGQPCGLLRGPAKDRRKELKRGLGYYVINYEGLAVVEDDLAPLIREGVVSKVVIDELSHYGDGRSRRYKTANRLFNQPLTPVPHLWGLTGTPGADTLAVHPMCMLVNDREMPWKSLRSWQSETQCRTGREQWMWQDKPSAPGLISMVMRPNIRFTTESVLRDLPPTMTERRQTELTAEQAKAHREMVGSMITMLKSGEAIEAKQKSALLAKLFQIDQGVVYTDKGLREIDSSPREASVAELVRRSGAKTVVFRAFIGGCDKLAKALNAAGIPTAKVDGSVTGKARDDIFREFQTTDKWRALVAHPRTTAYGTELAAADQLILDGPMLSGTHTYLQGLKRLSSSRQKSGTVRVVELSATKEEARFQRALRARGGYAEAVAEVFESILEEG